MIDAFLRCEDTKGLPLIAHGFLEGLVRFHRGHRNLVSWQIKSRLGQLPLCSSLTAAQTSMPRRTILHPRRTAAKLRK
jgi:hypothetical protein